MDFEGGGLAHLDFLLRMDWGLCVVEVDEGAHCIREQADEAARMLKVRARHAKEPLRFVRYNPDCFGVSGQLAEVPQSERHARLRRRGHLHELEVGDLHQDPPARQHEPAQLHLELAAPAGQVAGVLASQMRTRSQFSLNLTKLLPRELVFRQDCMRASHFVGHQALAEDLGVAQGLLREQLHHLLLDLLELRHRGLLGLEADGHALGLGVVEGGGLPDDLLNFGALPHRRAAGARSCRPWCWSEALPAGSPWLARLAALSSSFSSRPTNTMPPAERAPSPLSTAECVGVNLALLACLLVLWAFSFPSTNEAPGAVHSGTGSVGRAFEARGWEVTSLDSNPKARPSICCDILQWDYKAFEPGHFDMVWASPYCTEFSIALKKRPRNLPVGDALVLKTFEIIDYLKPRWWAIENPSTGRLKTRPYMQGLHMDRVTYCKYGFRYKKPTAVWHNLPWTPSHGPCCEAFEGTRHPEAAQRGPTKGRQGSNSRDQLYSILPALCDEIAASATLGVNGECLQRCPTQPLQTVPARSGPLQPLLQLLQPRPLPPLWKQSPRSLRPRPPARS